MKTHRRRTSENWNKYINFHAKKHMQWSKHKIIFIIYCYYLFTLIAHAPNKK